MSLSGDADARCVSDIQRSYTHHVNKHAYCSSTNHQPRTAKDKRQTSPGVLGLEVLGVRISAGKVDPSKLGFDYQEIIHLQQYKMHETS